MVSTQINQLKSVNNVQNNVLAVLDQLIMNATNVTMNIIYKEIHVCIVIVMNYVKHALENKKINAYPVIQKIKEVFLKSLTNVFVVLDIIVII